MKRQYNTDRESFISISTAWTFGLICFSTTQVLKNGKTDDFEPIIFWSLIFTLIAWLIFIRTPLNRINPSSRIFNKFFFPLLTTIYGLIVFVILIGWGFIDIDFYEVFVQAGVMGLSFGLVYTFVTTNRLKSKRERTIGYLTPMAILTIFLWIFPTILPTTAFRFMPESIRSQIIKLTIKDFKVGDDFTDLKKRLPGWFDRNEFSDLDNGEYNSTGGLGGLKIFGLFYYSIQVHCNRIVVLQYSDKEDGYKDLLPINGRIHEEPCR